MNHIAQEQLTVRDAEIARIRTAADAARRRERVRSKLLEILGGLPDYRGPLNARVTGRLTNAGAINTNLFDAVIPGFLLHWDLADLLKAIAGRKVQWTDPADWMGRTAPGLGGAFSYRYSDQKDEPY